MQLFRHFVFHSLQAYYIQIRTLLLIVRTTYYQTHHLENMLIPILCCVHCDLKFLCNLCRIFHNSNDYKKTLNKNKNFYNVCICKYRWTYRLSINLLSKNLELFKVLYIVYTYTSQFAREHSYIIVQFFLIGSKWKFKIIPHALSQLYIYIVLYYFWNKIGSTVLKNLSYLTQNMNSIMSRVSLKLLTAFQNHYSTLQFMTRSFTI